MKSMAVNIITGFLGSGKTTLVSNLLKKKPECEKWAVIINEFGEIAIDFITLQGITPKTDSVVQISGGCICCTSKDYFEENLKHIIDEQQPDRIIIEPTGLGGIEMVKEIIGKFEALELKPIICLADIRGEDNARLQMNMLYQSQLRDSDIIVVSKCDLENAEVRSLKLIDCIKSKYPSKNEFYRISKGNLDMAVLDSKPKKQTQKNPDKNFTQLLPIFKEENYRQYYFKADAEKLIDLEALEQCLTHCSSIIRSKGYVNTRQGWMLFNLVMGDFSIEQAEPQEYNYVVIIQDSKAEKFTFHEFVVN